MPTPEQFHELTAKLKILVEKDKEQRILAEASLVNSQLDALAKIKALYPHEVDKNYNRYVAPFLDRYAFLKRPSCLAIIKNMLTSLHIHYISLICSNPTRLFYRH